MHFELLPSSFRPSTTRYHWLRYIIVVLAALISLGAHAFPAFRISDIRVEGNQFIDIGTILNLAKVRADDVIDDEVAETIIKDLHASDFFKQVTLNAEGRILVIQVVERPAVADITFSGTKISDQENLLKALRGIGIQEGRPFNPALVARAETEIKRQYLARGFYGATVRATLSPQEQGRISIAFAVAEGKVARIHTIKIIGNKAIAESDLLDLLNLRAPGFLTWYTSADEYSRQKLTADLDILRSYYQDRGFVEMQVDSTQVAISPDKQDIFITVNITEGEQYKIADVKLDGYTLGIAEDLKQLITVKPNELYSAQKVTESQKAISDRLADAGYAFGNVFGNPDIDKKEKKINLTFLVDPGRRVYVRNVNIVGNTQTRDYVIRRQIRQQERAWFNGEKIRLSRDRIDRLGFFSEVSIETPEVIGTNDQVDLNVGIKEKETGSIRLGVGYSTTDGFTIDTGIEQPNLFGTGEGLGFSITRTQTSETYSLSLVNPYFTKFGVSRALSISSSNTISPTVGSEFSNNTTTSGIRFGVPYSETGTVFWGLNYENIELSASSTSPIAVQQYIRQFGDGTRARTTSFPVTISWQRDTRNSGLIPTNGTLQKLGSELVFLGDLNYYRLNYSLQYFYPLTRKLTFASNFEVAYGRAGAGKPYPVFKNYYVGGLGSVRGYTSASIAPEGVSPAQNVGGNARNIINFEVLGPFPGSGNDRTLRWYFFADGGAVYNGARNLGTNLLYSAGAGISWITPVGPLRFNWARAINPRPNDSTQFFQFQIGTSF